MLIGVYITLEVIYLIQSSSVWNSFASLIDASRKFSIGSYCLSSILRSIYSHISLSLCIPRQRNRTNRGIGLFQFTFPTRKEGLLKNVPDYKNNWKGQVDYFLSEPEAKGYLKQNFNSGNEAAEYLMNKNLRPAKELRLDRTQKHNAYIKKFLEKF